jgi:energy-coupling factor transporter ATP-binding protein EcfA2
MKKTALAPKTVLDTILDWSQDRPVWQRDALRRIVSKGRPGDADVKELIDLCKQGRGGRNTSLKPDPLAKSHLPANPGQGEAVSLVSVADVEGVNNLAPGQTLSFEQNSLTIVYGDNGAGKSGYARILKRACRARYAGKIEPNVYAQQPPPRASATIVYSIGDVQQPPEEWEDADHPHARLSAVSVFDSDYASVHINEKNEVAFRPYGLDVPDELANVCQAVKEALTAEQNQLEKSRNPILSKPSWQETTAAGKAIASLRHDTDLQKIAALATLSGEENARMERLKEDLSKNPAKAAAEQTLKADNIKTLLSRINVLEGKTADAALTAVFSLDREARLKRETARLAAEKAFSGESLEGIGGEVWRALWDSARRYSTQIAYPEQKFPASQQDARCVLCQQPLQPEALKRMARFEEFIQKDTEHQAQKAEEAIKTARQEISSLIIGTRPLKANLQEVRIQNADLVRRTRRFVATARLRRYAFIKALGSAQGLRLPDIGPDPAADLAQLENGIRNYAGELQKSAMAGERQKLETELAELNDRALLGGMLQTVQEEVDRLKVIDFIAKCLADTSTTAITKLGNDLADTVITPKLRDRFQEEIVKLAAEKVRVEIVRSGGKFGSPQYQVRLFAKPEAKVENILSEGEQTCVALASFLTELATATQRSTLVFDDPVSSLDHRWRTGVAKRLVEEAEHRQIIVFTHDLIFVNDLDDLADQKKRPVQLITVERGPAGAGMVTQGLPWKGKSVEDRIDKLEKAARAAKKLYDDNKEAEYNREAAGIYNNLRASWERALEDIVFFRVVQRHRDYIDIKNLKKVTVLSDSDCDIFQAGFKKCCDIIDAHDPSSGRNAAPPAPKDLAQDIQTLKDWIGTLRERQKKIA